MKKRFKSTIRALVAGGSSVLLVACGGGGGGGGDSTETETGTTSTLSGDVELVDGTADVRSWDERLLAFFMADARAALGGLIDAPDGTLVRLIRIDQDGNEVDQLDATTTEGGRFTFDLGSDVETGGDLIIEAGPASDPVRAPAGGEDILVNPVSSMIVNRVLARVQGGAAFSDYRAADLANLIGIIVEELERTGVTFSGSNQAAAEDAETEAGTAADGLIASVEGENAVADNFIGTKNLAVLDVLLEAFGDTAGFAAVNQTLAADITSSLRLDGSGQTSEESRSERGWSFDGSGGVSSTGAQTTATETIPEGEGFALTVGKDGRLFALNGAIRGAVSADGQLFAMTETRTELEGQGSSFGVFAGASTWTPGDVNKIFNFVKFDGYVDKDFTNDQVGFTTTLTGEATLDCTGGDCSLDLDRFLDGGAFRKFYSQVGPDDANLFDTGSSSNDGVLGLSGITLQDGGRLTGEAAITVDGTPEAGEFRTRGFLAPDSRMLVAQLSGTDKTRFEDFIVGLPRGTSCTDGTLNGTYNTVWLTGVLSGAAPRQVATENEAFSLDADGQGGITIPAASFREAVLTFEGTDTNLSRDVIGDTGDSVGYSVDAECKLEIADAAPGDVVLGAVSPDGEVFVLATYAQEGSDETFQSIAIGMRRPAQQ